jgi:hypothetical protein
VIDTVVIAGLAAALALAVDGLYIAILLSEGEGDLAEPVSIGFATAIGLAAVALVIPWRRAWLSAGAGVVLAACAVVSGFSIGVLLVPSVVLALIASSRA